MCEEPQNEQQWYAIRVTYSREMAAKSYLDSIGIESYVPMHFAERTYGGKRRKVWEPLIHNLLFIRTSADRLREIKATTTLADPLHHGPRKQIAHGDSGAADADFMAVVATQNEHVEIVAPQDVDLEKGDPVRVTEGMFAGIEGRYIRHKGHSKVAVAIRNVATALTAYIPLKYIAKID